MQKLVPVSIRIPKELHTFLRKTAFEQDISMNSIILKCLKKFKKREEKKLTQNNSMIL
jgi:predicted HicB family RNase H-like nuclease